MQRKTSFCEWKGVASYYSFTPPGNQGAGEVIENRIWGYENPTPRFEVIKNHLSFYASAHPQDQDQDLRSGGELGNGKAGWRCEVDGVVVQPQKSDFYGGWVYPGIKGKMKGRELFCFPAGFLRASIVFVLAFLQSLLFLSPLVGGVWRPRRSEQRTRLSMYHLTDPDPRILSRLFFPILVISSIPQYTLALSHIPASERHRILVKISYPSQFAPKTPLRWLTIAGQS